MEVGDGNENENKEKDKVCVVCGSKADKSCGSCLSTHYCSVEHQKSDWKAHRKTCPPMRIHQSEELGRHYIATRDLKAGQPLLTESAVLVQPIDGVGGAGNICTVCCSYAPYTCINCDWLMCASDTCQMQHTEECHYFKHRGLTWTSGFGMLPITIYRAIYLKNEKPDVWARINDLQYLEKSGIEDVECKELFLELFKTMDIPESDFTQDEVEKLVRITKINAYTLIRFESNEKRTMMLHAGILYVDASIFANNCFSNCAHSFGPAPNFVINIWTSVPVSKGQVLSVAYENNSPRLGSMVKQKEAQLRSRFSCVCPRCLDPTELGTMMSGIKCLEKNCSNGFLLPINPTDLNLNSLWKCTTVDCTGNDIWENIDKKTSELMWKVEEFDSFDNDYDVKKFDELLKKSLHGNHWIILSFYRNLVENIMLEVEKNPDPDLLVIPKGKLKYGLAFVKHLLELSNTTTPGLNYQRIELFAHQVMMKVIGANLYAFLDSEVEEQETRQLLNDFMILKKLNPPDCLGINFKLDFLKIGYEHAVEDSMEKLLMRTHLTSKK